MQLQLDDREYNEADTDRQDAQRPVRDGVSGLSQNWMSHDLSMEAYRVPVVPQKNAPQSSSTQNKTPEHNVHLSQFPYQHHGHVQLTPKGHQAQLLRYLLKGLTVTYAKSCAIDYLTIKNSSQFKPCLCRDV